MAALPPSPSLTERYSPISFQDMYVEDEEDEKESSPDVSVEDAPPFDVEAICTTIRAGTPVIEIAATSPEVLYQLCAVSPSKMKGLFQTHMTSFGYSDDQQQQIKKIMLILYTMSLWNSSWNETMRSLEANIVECLILSQQQSFQDLLVEANQLLSQELPQHAEGVHLQLISLYRLTSAIQQRLNLYFYLEPQNKERIEHLYTNTKNADDTLTFPRCKLDFSTLCQNLQLCQHKRQQLAQMQIPFRLRDQQLQKKATELCAKPSLRKQFYDTHAVAFWQAGAQLLETAFRTIFQKLPEKRICLFKTLLAAIRTASRDDRFKDLNFKTLIENNQVALPEEYVSAVWLSYLDPENPIAADVDDIMRHILSKLPDHLFQNLVDQLKTSTNRNQTIFDIVNDYLENAIRGPVTFMSLRRWLESPRS